MATSYLPVATTLAEAKAAPNCTTLNLEYCCQCQDVRSQDGHTATLLPDGTVLLAGGGSASHHVPPFASAELYDPTTGRFSDTGSLGTGRSNHAAVLLTTGHIDHWGHHVWFGEFDSGMASAEIYTPPVLTPAPVLFSLSGDGQGQGAIWNGVTGQSASGG